MNKTFMFMFMFAFMFMGSNVLASDTIEVILNNNLGEKIGVTSVTNQRCKLQVEENNLGYTLIYYPGWSDGGIGQVVDYPDSNKWSNDTFSRTLFVRLFTGPSNNGLAKLKYNEAGQIILGQLDDDADVCYF